MSSQASLRTLHYLQSIDRIPSSLQPIRLSSSQLILPPQHRKLVLKQQASQPLLICSIVNCIYFGAVDADGLPDDIKGIYIFVDGAWYEGRLNHGKLNGKGKLTKMEGTSVTYSYEGEWKDSKPNGYGEEFILGSSTYKGQFKASRKHGKGVLTYADNSSFEGQFREGAIEGEGVFRTAGNEWRGRWMNGYLQGEGEQTIFDALKESANSTYKGMFRYGCKEGHGVYRWGRQNYLYEGNFKAGQLHGEGRLVVGKAQFVGEWQKGVEVSLSKIEEGMQQHRMKSSIKFTNSRSSKALTNSIPLKPPIIQQRKPIKQ